MASETHSVATLTNVSKAFGAFPAIRNLTLTVSPGSITMLLGENGAGKSTLLRLLAGLAAPTHGSVTVFGGPPAGEPPPHRVHVACANAL